MSLKNKINSDHLIAFKAKDAISKSILSVIKGEIQTQEKNLNVPDLQDSDVVKILAKTVKSLNETISKSDDMESKLQLEVISKYLPSQMSESEVSEIISEMISKNQDIKIGDIMKEFSKLNADKKMVSQIFNSLKLNS
jgi:uncharacterized protein YqeY